MSENEHIINDNGIKIIQSIWGGLGSFYINRQEKIVQTKDDTIVNQD